MALMKCTQLTNAKWYFHSIKGQGVLLVHFQMCGDNVNSASHFEVLLKGWDAICRKYPGRVAYSVQNLNKISPHLNLQIYMHINLY
jgi:hypothetical protein